MISFHTFNFSLNTLLWNISAYEVSKSNNLRYATVTEVSKINRLNTVPVTNKINSINSQCRSINQTQVHMATRSINQTQVRMATRSINQTQVCMATCELPAHRQHRRHLRASFWREPQPIGWEIPAVGGRPIPGRAHSPPCASPHRLRWAPGL